MQKFLTNMLYAIIAYVAIYAILISYMRITAEDAEMFCKHIEPGMTLNQLTEKAETEGFAGMLAEWRNRHQNGAIHSPSE